ncbi:MAG TPA: hypothetical protein PLI53_03430 [Geobacteraceae bacterium]|nr:hypothetical protein [Geobacteraceae bacterium]
MEPLVIFGAFLVIYCGYLALIDTICSWRTGRVKATRRKPAKKRTATPVAARRPRTMAGIPVGSPLPQKM